MLGKATPLQFKIGEFIIHFSLQIAVFIMVTGMIIAYLFLSSTTKTLTNQTAQINAQRYLEALSAFRTLYTNEVVNTAKKQNITISHDYKNIKNAIPLPATLSMALGKEIGKFQSGAKTFLYSPYPFPWRDQENKEIFKQDFSQQAWESLTNAPEKPFFRFEEIDGQMSIRYAVADVMRQGCVDCHNSHEQTPKNDWQFGDVRGVMEVVLPINKAQFSAQSSLQATFIVLFSMMVLITLVLFIFFNRIKKDAKKLAYSNQAMVKKQQQVNFANEEMTIAIDKLELKTKELTKSNQVKSDFMATMSHEIRTPLNGVIGMLNLLKQSAMTHEQNHHAHLATTSADSLLNLINDLLDFSKIEADKLIIESVTLHLDELISDIAATMSHTAREKNLAIIVDVSQLKHTKAQGDPHRIKQILNNLISNAIKFTAQGSISISTSIEPINEQHLQFTCSVSDTGIGIAPQKLKLVFERFTQEDSSTTRQYGGTGLGLAIVKRLCQLMHGDISVTSELGKGSTFHFTLRLDICSTVEDQPPQIDWNTAEELHISDKQINKTGQVVSENTFELKPKSLLKNDNTIQAVVRPLPEFTRILLVEDNSINQIVAKTLLTNLGAQVDIANNGEIALTLLEKQHYDVVLMDCQMPIMDGYTATKTIRKSQRDYKDIYIIAMTANAMSGDRDKCITAGMDDYLTKPIDVAALEKSLLKALNIPLETPPVNIDKTTTDIINNAELPLEEKLNQADIIWGKEGFYKRVGQNQLLAERIVTIFCQDMPTEISLLKQAIIEKNDSLIESIAHKIKGSSANLEATKLTKSALDLEQAVKQNNHADIEPLSLTVITSFDELIIQFEAFLVTNVQNE